VLSVPFACVCDTGAMESPSRGSRYPASSRVAHKLGSDIALVAIPHRPRPRAGTGGRDRAATTTKLLLESPSLAGTTAPNSPTLAEFPGSGSADDAIDGPPRPTTPQMKLRVHDGDGSPPVDASMRDLSYRKHHRGIGSIDSMLSSTTCVNTQSECSRPASRVSPNRYDTGGIPDVLMLEEAAKYAYAQDSDDLPGLVVLESLTPTHRMHFVSANSPSFSPSPIAVHGDYEGEDGSVEETKVVNEISSWVLRLLWGKEVDECIAPLLVADCTNRYLQELWTAAENGTLKSAAASPDQASSSPNDGFKQETGNNGYGQPLQSGNGKGKRKADGGSEDGDEFGDSDGGKRDEEGNNTIGAQRQPVRLGANSNFSCPYRKRNPLRFNVREYYVCATHSFADMSQLK